MANTTYLKETVERYVRQCLGEKFGRPFSSRFLALTRVQGRAHTHEFDAVSEDGTIVCSIKTASWKTGGGKRGSGKIQGAYAEIYFLDHVDAEQKYLVLTDSEFYRNLERNLRGRLAPGIGLMDCELPSDLRNEIDKIRVTSRGELGF